MTEAKVIRIETHPDWKFLCLVYLEYQGKEYKTRYDMGKRITLDGDLPFLITSKILNEIETWCKTSK